MSVVLPAPFGPSKPKISPSPIVRSTPFERELELRTPEQITPTVDAPERLVDVADFDRVHHDDTTRGDTAAHSTTFRARSDPTTRPAPHTALRTPAPRT